MQHARFKTLPKPFRITGTCTVLALLLSMAPAEAVISCPATGTPPGTPVAVSASNPQYFTYKGILTPLVGMSHEYICHIPQPARDSIYCTLASYPGVLGTLQTNKNNVIRLWTIFNHSPGTGPFGAPFTNEQPFMRSGGKWDLRSPDNTYLANLEAVVCAAYNKDIVVEVSLLDPWDGDWTTGPFNPANTVSYVDPNDATKMVTPGFSQEHHFISYENPATKTDSTSAAKEARKHQKRAIEDVVNRLKKYPNIIWEVANEPDYIGGGATPQSVADFEKDMIAVIRAKDTAHPIMVNGHTDDPVNGTTFAWTMTNAKAASLHYTRHTSSTLYGAIELQRTAAYDAARANMPLAFNENRFVSGTARTADAVRSEAWEFMLNEGGMFDAYSIDRSAPAAQNASAQLAALHDFLIAPAVPAAVPTYISNLATVQKTSCNGASDWCKGLPAYGTSDTGACMQTANAYWATMKSNTDLALYIHHATQMSGTFGGYAAKPCGDGTPGNGYSTSSLQYRVPQAGCWSVVWIDPATGTKLAGGIVNLPANTWLTPSSFPYYRHDIAFLATFVGGSC